MIIHIPGKEDFEVKYAIFDFNGTLAVDGIISDTVKEKLFELSKVLTLYVITSDTYGTARAQLKELPIVLTTLEGAASAQKSEIVKGLGADYCVCFGNGFNDVDMFKCARLSIAIALNEGICAKLLGHADIFVTSILDGIDLLLKPDRLTAGLRS